MTLTPKLFVHGEGARIYFPDGTNTKEFLKTKIAALDKINSLHDHNIISTTEQFDLWSQLFQKDELPTESIMDNIILLYLTHYQGKTIRNIGVQTCTSKTCGPTLHAHMYVYIIGMDSRYQHAPVPNIFDKQFKVPGIHIQSQDEAMRIIKMLYKYKLLSVNKYATIQEEIKKIWDLIDPN